MHSALVAVEKVLLFKIVSLMNFLKFVLLVGSVSVMAQKSVTDVKELMTFSPDETSIKFNEVYTDNFFFGNFGIKPLVNVIPINNSKVKSIKISAEKGGKKIPNVMELNYDKEGKISKLKVSEMLAGNAREVTYKYQGGVIAEEIFKDAKSTKSNKFYYSNGKMVVENFKGVVDVFQLNGNVLYKNSYLNGKPVFSDRFEGKCRITTYLKEDIDKTCYSNFQSELPMVIEEFVASYSAKGKPTLVPENKWELKKVDELNYAIYRDGKEIYQVKLDKDKRVKTFQFLGNKSENQPAVTYSFAYTYY